MAAIRVRHAAGAWTFSDVNLKDSVDKFIKRIEEEKKVTVTKISSQQNYSNDLQRNKSLADNKINNRDSVFIKLGAGTVVVDNTTRKIDENGKVVSEDNDKNSFKPGLPALRDMKMKWTLTDMVLHENQYQFELKGTKEDLCSRASLDQSACQAFNEYITRSLQMKQCRCGIMYGKYIDSDAEAEKKARDEALKQRDEKHNKAYGSTKQNMDLKDLGNLMKNDHLARQGVLVEAIYEPKQVNHPDKFELLEDREMENRVNEMAKKLGLQAVGFIVCRSTKEKFNKVNVASHEIIAAAEASLEANNGNRKNPFALVTVTQDANKGIHFEAYSLTDSCLDMVAEEALKIHPEKPDLCDVVSPFVAIVEKKEAHIVDNDFFIKTVPIVNSTSPFAEQGKFFERYNRDLSPAPTPTSFKSYATAKLGAANRNPTDADMEKLLGNFHVLIFLFTHFAPDAKLMDEVCDWLKKRVYDKNTKVAFPAEHKRKILTLAGL